MSNSAPLGWNKTVHDLMTEVSQGKRQQLSGTDDEFIWAIEYERSLLPSGTVFPRKNQVWETIRDCEVRFVAVYEGQAGQVGAAWLPTTERVRILADCEQAVSVSLLPLRYDELHNSIVPEGIRQSPSYRDYLLDLRVSDFNEHFLLVERV
jgi:hypothetical protein